MASIQLLENSTINKIAAGEVVERPASVAKELMENAIDAGATAITIEIADGGVGLVRISDNGCGIPREQVKTAFLRHATSKIANMDDLEQVMTLGFRGEALSSIASVSQVELVTKTKESISGTKIVLLAGEVVEFGETGCADGTTFIMRNLFYNTPARRKFLKKHVFEGGAISDIVTKMALGHPEIAFTYINNGSVILQTNGDGNLKNAVFQAYGKDMATFVLPVMFEKEGFVLTGLLGKAELCRANRSYEHFYINGRFVKSDIVQAAVESAYQTRLPIGKFPAFVLSLQAKPDFVDVNVHPTKLEVRFSDETLMYSLVYEAVEQTFKGQQTIPKQIFQPPTIEKEAPLILNDIVSTHTPVRLDTRIPQSHNSYFEPTQKQNTQLQNSQAEAKENATLNIKNEEIFPKTIETILPLTPTKPMEQEVLFSPVTNMHTKPEPFFKNYKIVGQIFNTYWILEQHQSIYLLDQHAAHERVLFDEVTNKFKTGQVVSQRLLTPLALSLTQKEQAVLKENMELFTNFGFEIEPFGDNVFAVRAVPYLFKNPAPTSFFLELLDQLAHVTTAVSNVYETKITALATISCKAAVKANDKLDYIEAKNLVEQILKLESPFTCPHGRPTVVEITKYELEKMFKRV